MNNTNPLVSIIVPVYKVERYIHRSIDSLLRQTYNNLEIILVDDGSPDNCPFICDKYAMQDNRIRVIHKSNGGLSDARNAALNVMTGQYVTFVDSDDYIADNMIEKFIETVKLYQCNMVVAGMNIIDKNNQNLKEFTPKRIELPVSFTYLIRKKETEAINKFIKF